MILEACRLVGKASQLHFVDVADLPEDPIEALTAICEQSGLIFRLVHLDGNWRNVEGLPLLGFSGKTPVALLWSHTRYVQIDPKTGEEKEATGLLPFAYTFYEGLPKKGFSLLKLSMRGNWGSLFQLLGLGSLGALIGLFSPFITKQLFDRVIPDADWSLLYQILMGLGVVALSSFLFQIVRSLILFRLEGLIQNRLDVALWDRLFKLPLPFFRRFATGDLIQRTAIVDSARELMGGYFLQLLVSTVLSLFYLIPMFYLSWELSCIGLSVLGFFVLVSLYLLWHRNRFQRLFLEFRAKMNQFLIQLVGGIDKIRVAAAENRAFAHWDRLFSASQKEGYFYGKVQNWMTLATALLSVTALFFVYFWMLEWGTGLTIGTFMAFNAAFTPLSQTVSSLLSAMIAFIAFLPSWERGKVILEALPEGRGQKVEISGEIQIKNVTFSYNKEPVLNNINLNIKPGEWIGIAGHSGSGKSTLLRLLIGFEIQREGAIYYDRMNLDLLETKHLRNQLGVVLQNSRISAGTIYENIVYGRKATLKQIQKAVGASCFDEVLTDLPLGLDTPLPTGGGTLSGGQIQRLLLARALLMEPKVVLLDEATSALDSALQEKVMGNLARMRMTRLVVAHRLSTIQAADRIYVLDKGSIVEQGSYGELIKKGGLFSRFAEQQKV